MNRQHFASGTQWRDISWLILLLASLGLSACHHDETTPPGPRPAVILTIGEMASPAWSVYSGEVHARHEVDQSFRIGGKIIERRVNLGDQVHKGQEIARLDPQDVKLSAVASQAAVSAAQADLTLAQAEFERARNLAAQKFISTSVLDTRRSQLEAAEAKLAQAKAQSNVSGNQVGYATLTADRDGVVTALPVEAGQVLAAGQAVARIADPAELEVLIWLPETRANTLKPGMPAMIRPWNDQSLTLPAQVREIAGSADSTTRTYAVRVKLLQPDKRLSLGSTAAVAFANAGSAAEIKVPLPAITQHDKHDMVWVVDRQNRVQARQIEVGEYRDGYAVVKQGLNKGDRVVTYGAHTLTTGLQVRPVEQQAPIALDIAR